ncbi:hypothetical protein RFI_03188, partial [Reticulomyxa filosa]
MTFDEVIDNFEFQKKFEQVMQLKEMPNIQTHVTDFYELKATNEAIAQLDNVFDPDGEIITFDENEDNKYVKIDSIALPNDEVGGAAVENSRLRGASDSIHTDSGEDQGNRPHEMQKSEANVFRMGTIDSTKEDSYFNQGEVEVWIDDDINADDDDDDDDDDENLPYHLREQHAKHSTSQPLSLLARLSHAASGIRLTNLGVPREKQISNPLTPSATANSIAFGAPLTPLHYPTSPFGVPVASPK